METPKLECTCLGHHLRGGVLKSDELSDLYDRGFYIWKIKWKVKENLEIQIYLSLRPSLVILSIVLISHI